MKCCSVEGNNGDTKITIKSRCFEKPIVFNVSADIDPEDLIRDFELAVTNNDTRHIEGISSGETNSFFVAVNNNPDMYSKLTFTDNKLENKHVLVDGVPQNEGKGMFLLATSTLRSTPLPVFASNNSLENLILRSSEVTGENSAPALFTITSTANTNYTTAGTTPYNFTELVSTI